MALPTKSQIIASSSAWIAAFLNFIPGIGTGYLYQRRWKAYWITTLTSAGWVYIDLINELSIDTSDPAASQTNNTGLLGLLLISSISAYEAVYRVKKEREKNLPDEFSSEG